MIWSCAKWSIAPNSISVAAVIYAVNDDDDPQLSDTFNDLLARAYLHDEPGPVKDLLRTHGLTDLPH